MRHKWEKKNDKWIEKWPNPEKPFQTRYSIKGIGEVAVTLGKSELYNIGVVVVGAGFEFYPY